MMPCKKSHSPDKICENMFHTQKLSGCFCANERILQFKWQFVTIDTIILYEVHHHVFDPRIKKRKKINGTRN